MCRTTIRTYLARSDFSCGKITYTYFLLKTDFMLLAINLKKLFDIFRYNKRYKKNEIIIMKINPRGTRSLVAYYDFGSALKRTLVYKNNYKITN